MNRGIGLEQATPVAESRGSSELTVPSEAATADLPAPPLSVEDVIAAALEETCIVLAGVGGAAAAATPGGGWLVAAAIPPGRLSSRKKDGTKNNNVDVASRVEDEEDGPKTVTSCTQWEESDVLVENAPKVSPRTIPQLWAKKTTPTIIVSNPFFVGVEDKPATKPDAKAATEGGRYRANGETMEVPARSVSGREAWGFRARGFLIGRLFLRDCSGWWKLRKRGLLPAVFDWTCFNPDTAVPTN